MPDATSTPIVAPLTVRHRCYCRRWATVQVRITQFSADGRVQEGWLWLCDECLSVWLEVEKQTDKKVTER